jgi:hypothetical protein
MKKCPFCAEEIQDAAVVCKHCGRDLTDGASQVQIVAPKKKTGLAAWGCLTLIVLVVVTAIANQCGPGSNDAYRTRPGRTVGETRATAPELAFLSARGGRSSDSYFTVEGQVQNLTDRPLPSVEAVVTWYTKTDQFISAESALVEYDPLLPGQTSPFKVITRANPAMDKYSVEFKQLRGGPLRVDDRRKK